MNRGDAAIDLIIITSDEPWSDIWHTQLHYAYQLSKRFRVIFIDPPKPWKPSHLFDFGIHVRSVSENLTLFRYKNWLPSQLGRLATRLNDFINQFLVRKMMKELRQNSRIIVWHFDPYRFLFNFRNNSNVKHIHHVIDPVAGFHLDGEMSKRSDLVVVTSPRFLKHYEALNKNCIQVGQGADIQFFQKTFSESELQLQVSWNSILLLGTFTDEINYPLLHRIAERYPSKLVLIGPNKITAAESRAFFEALTKREGVHWLGAMNPAAFHIHLAACRVGIIAYSYSNFERNNLRSPLKVISYLACGKCIISNIECEIPSLENRAIYLVHNEEAYFELLDASYKNELVFDREQVRNYLESIDYGKLLSRIFSKLGAELPPER